MFKFIILSALVAVAMAKPGALYSSPLLATLVGEKTIESHGNSVVHSSAPVIQHAALPAVTYQAVQPASVVYQAAAPAHLVAEKTVSSYGHNIVHHQPVIATAAYLAPSYYL